MQSYPIFSSESPIWSPTTRSVSYNSENLETCFNNISLSDDFSDYSQINKSFLSNGAHMNINDNKNHTMEEFPFKVLMSIENNQNLCSQIERKSLKNENFKKDEEIFKQNSKFDNEIKNHMNLFCLCSLDRSEYQTRNLRISDINMDLEYLLNLFKNFGEIQNFDLCNFPSFLTISFYDIKCAIEAYYYFNNEKNFEYYSDVSFINSLNRYEFIDYILINLSFQEKNNDIETFFSLFGEINEIIYHKKSVIIKYNDLRSIEKLNKCLENYKINETTQLKSFKSMFFKLSDIFIKRILSATMILNADNSTDFLLNNLNVSLQENKENILPENNSRNNEIRKKCLKVTSENFCLSEITSVNESNILYMNTNLKNKIINYKEKVQNPISYVIDINSIRTNNEKRTTIMIRNIPNRYNQESLLQVIDVNFKGLYDFFYLPMDFKNKCNIGYAFINFISIRCIIDFYLEFHNKRWDLLRSEKICCICFARIQGRNNLIKHFKKSNVIHLPLDKNYKPLILPNPFYDSIIF